MKNTTANRYTINDRVVVKITVYYGDGDWKSNRDDISSSFGNRLYATEAEALRALAETNYLGKPRITINRLKTELANAETELAENTRILNCSLCGPRIIAQLRLGSGLIDDAGYEAESAGLPDTDMRIISHEEMQCRECGNVVFVADD